MFAPSIEIVLFKDVYACQVCHYNSNLRTLTQGKTMVVEILKLTFRTVIMIRNLIGLSVHNVMNNRNVGKSKKQL